MKLSVMTVSYNQAEYVEQALESALKQEADFDWELVIGDDCSTDGTREIVRRHADMHPDRVRLVEHESRLGMHANIMATYHACVGEYVAVLEGDDYWTSPHKLQRQAEFLDSHPDCVLCFHRARLLEQDTGRDFDYGPSMKQG